MDTVRIPEALQTIDKSKLPEMRVLTEAEVHQLIKIGDTYEEVLRKLGKPTHDYLSRPKEPWRQEIFGRDVMYKYKQFDIVFNQRKDWYLSLYFDVEGRLKNIHYNSGKTSDSYSYEKGEVELKK